MSDTAQSSTGEPDVAGTDAAVAPAPGPPVLVRQLTGTADADISEAATATVGSPIVSPPAAVAAGAPKKPAAASAATRPVYSHVLGAITDPGVAGKVNQDTFFTWNKDPAGKRFAAGVFDGHGREMGRCAALAASESFVRQLDDDATWAAICKDPKKGCTQVFEQAHKDVKQAFIKAYEANGWEVKEEAGFLLRRQYAVQGWLCVHGGTTGTVAICVDGRRVIIANVGDSTAVLTGVSCDSALRPVQEWGEDAEASQVRSVAANGVFAPAAVTQLSSDHSPENPDEFVRIRNFRPCPHRANHPELLFVYDSLSSSKMACPPIFVLDAAGKPTARNRGSYYKNVRDEWATLVAVPPYGRFQDALAFTRSIGDFHLQTYGVSHEPAVCWLDLGAAAAGSGSDDPPSLAAGAGVGSGAGSSEPSTTASSGTTPPIGLVLCSDGVWDNWKFEDVADFFGQPANTGEASSKTGTQAVVEKFMTANLERARINFGTSADNMTAVLCYLAPKES